MLEGSILDQLRMAHQPGQVGRRLLNFGVYYKNTLVSLCHALEDCILTCSTQPLVITAFQRGKWYLQEADHYGELAQKAQQIVIMATPEAGFAEHPTSQRSNVDLVSLDANDPLAQEWHLMILAPSYSAMVLCQELSVADYGKHGMPTEDLERKFYGFWTFETNLVQEAMELAIAHIRNYDAPLSDRLTAQLQAISQSQVAQRDDLGMVVSRVVDYLETGHASLSHADHTQRAVLDSNLISNEVQAFLRMAQLTDQADAANPNAAAEVAALAEALGQLLDLPAWQLHRLRLAGLLHRLAPLQSPDAMLNASGSQSNSKDAADFAPCCPLLPGGQVLRTMPRLRAIATIITHQAEHWDGSGQPAGLAGDAIPLESRILALVANFQQRLAHLRLAETSAATDPTDPQTSGETLAKALAACRQAEGNRWDPKLSETLALLVCGLQQGLSLSVTMPKISAGLWLVDSHCSENLWG